VDNILDQEITSNDNSESYSRPRYNKKINVNHLACYHVMAVTFLLGPGLARCRHGRTTVPAALKQSHPETEGEKVLTIVNLPLLICFSTIQLFPQFNILVMTSLIGCSGFVGGNLLAKRSYDSVYRSTDIETIRGKSFDHIVCCGVQAMKWWANQHPEEDQAGIDRLLNPLSEVHARHFTLISTIDVYPTPWGVDENTVIERHGHHAYGLHRMRVEDWVKQQFERVLILRLPGLFGRGIKKNVIFDMLHDNGLEKIHPDGVFQYYDLRRLADDIDRAWELGIDLINLSTGQLPTAEIRDRFFPGKILGGTGQVPASYDMRSKHAGRWGGSDGYLYSKEQVVDDLASWLEEG
jgi:hypothetical protein